MHNSTMLSPDPRSSGHILNDALKNVEDLIRFEIQLAKVEIQEQAKKAVFAGGALVAGGVIALYGVAFLLVSLYLGVSYAIWPWISAVAIGVVLLLLGGTVAGAGFRKLRRVRMPEATLEALREDVEWVRKRTL